MTYSRQIAASKVTGYICLAFICGLIGIVVLNDIFKFKNSICYDHVKRKYRSNRKSKSIVKETQESNELETCENIRAARINLDEFDVKFYDQLIGFTTRPAIKKKSRRFLFMR